MAGGYIVSVEALNMPQRFRFPLAENRAPSPPDNRIHGRIESLIVSNSAPDPRRPSEPSGAPATMETGAWETELLIGKRRRRRRVAAPSGASIRRAAISTVFSTFSEEHR
ncbi:uncharacterized protein LOC122615225 [Drosophila teissieri]|uniref:uncharacterized protein LOC122615225 n=1 Tax=Drosophila teissieri TaxID=7243 RepID=UPI001CB9EB45|nr:uncharacterized protein LOC122615225 [Drosophila teissieri]